MLEVVQAVWRDEVGLRQVTVTMLEVVQAVWCDEVGLRQVTVLPWTWRRLASVRPNSSVATRFPYSISIK
jgi:hypothetical protein